MTNRSEPVIPAHLLIPSGLYGDEFLAAVRKARGIPDGEPFDPWDAEGMAILTEWSKLQSRRSGVKQFEALVAAGWTFEFPPGSQDPEPWQFYFRRPPRRTGRPGRLFLSTNQAWRAMVRERGDDPDATN